MPGSFPWRDARDAARRWMSFAEELLPAGAEFTDAASALGKRAPKFFFLFHRRGEEGRARLLALLRAEYEDRYPRQPWKELGFEDAASLERDFGAFLAESVR